MTSTSDIDQDLAIIRAARDLYDYLTDDSDPAGCIDWQYLTDLTDALGTALGLA